MISTIKGSGFEDLILVLEQVNASVVANESDDVIRVSYTYDPISYDFEVELKNLSATARILELFSTREDRKDDAVISEDQPALFVHDPLTTPPNDPWRYCVSEVSERAAQIASQIDKTKQEVTR